jgi:hypothetical protein
MQYEKLYNDANIDKHIDAASKKYDTNNMEKMIGVGLNMPFEAENSAARKNMYSSQYQQHVCLVEPEVPYISTAYENKFGQHSSSFITSDRLWHVFAKVEKFSNKPGHHYFLILMDDNNNMDVLERISYCHDTETYGFLYDNTFLDSLQVGSVIQKDDTMKKSISFDEFDNYRAGKNLNAMYVAEPSTTEDAIKVSIGASYKLARTAFKKVTVLINDNDIPLNLNGDCNSYKFIPDIGEEVKGGILCGTRTEKNDESFFAQSAERLRTTMINDITFKASGTVVDIDVYCNKDITSSNNSIYEGQLAFYINDNKRFCQEIVNLLHNFIDNTDYHKSFALSVLYTMCEDVVKGKQYYKDNIFSNIIVEITLYEKAPLQVGDKITSRYGGKGVISEIVPDDEMPKIYGTDTTVDLIWNIATCFNRENIGQLFELSCNFISRNLVQLMLTNCFDVNQCIEIIRNYYEHLSPIFAKAFMDEVKSRNLDSYEIAMADEYPLVEVGSMITEDMDGLYVALKPISEILTFEQLLNMYSDYSYMTPVFLSIPIKGSRGQIRYVKSQKPCIVAKQYIYRMKQNAEEKHSATALSATNIRNMNSKSKASKMFMSVHSNTPIRFGEMEGNIFKAMGAEIDVMNMMIYSNSPIGRRDANQMLTSYTFDVKLSEDAKSRSAEILNSIIKAMGARFEFKKIPIKYPDGEIGQLFVYQDPTKNKLFVYQNPSDNKLFVYQDPTKNKLFVYQDPTDNKLFVYQGDKEEERKK